MVDECKSNPCRNGATCKDYQGTYECIVSTFNAFLSHLVVWVPRARSSPVLLSLIQCKPGYQGVNCEYEVDECHSKPCLHGGTCINLINRFSCVCPSGTHGTCIRRWIYVLTLFRWGKMLHLWGFWSFITASCAIWLWLIMKWHLFICSLGVQCEVNVDDCAPKPGSWEPRCLNGGQCLDGIGRYTCSCPPGFVGEHCEGDLNECLSGPCHAPGSLDCVQLVNDYQCRCRLGYTGREIFAFFCTIVSIVLWVLLFSL